MTDPTSAKRTAEDAGLANHLTSLDGFRLGRILGAYPSKKMIALEGSFDGKNGKATRETICDIWTGQVVILEKKPFDPDTIAADVVQGHNLELDFDNAEYASYNAELPVRLNRLSCAVIHPATDKHIAKYSREELHMLVETPKVYQEVTKPYVEREELGQRIAWVHNIIDGKKEKERVMFRDDDPETGFILLPDMKWDQESTNSLYCLAIVTRRDLPSIRSLSAEHLPLLRNILDKGSPPPRIRPLRPHTLPSTCCRHPFYLLPSVPTSSFALRCRDSRPWREVTAKLLPAVGVYAGCAELKRRFGVDPGQLRVYLHYQPTFYHLHVHFTHEQAEAPGIEAGRAHLLADVIDNIALYPNYYQERTLHCALRTTLGLYKEFAKSGLAPGS